MSKNIDTICYTGIGSNTNGNHTKKQFLTIANKIFKRACSKHVKSLKCKSCKKSRELNTKEVYKQIKAQRKNKTYKMSPKLEQKLVDYIKKCSQCKNKNLKPCTLNNYLQYSGAVMGKCKSPS